VPPDRPSLQCRALLASLAGATLSATAGCPDAVDARVGPGPGTDAGWTHSGADPSRRAYLLDAAAPRSGATERWAVEGVSAYDRPVVAGGLALLPAWDSFHAFDAETGGRAWRFAPDGGSQGTLSLAVQDGTAFVGFRSNPGLYALDQSDGTERWRAGESDVYPAPVATEGGVLVGTDTGLLAGRPDGTVHWEYELFGRGDRLAIASGPGQTVHVGTSAGEVYALFASDDPDTEPESL
jgi:outer membrane protein assembly factor BamB